MKQHVFTFLILTSALGVFGQNFLTPTDLFSKKKESYITLTDGTELPQLLNPGFANKIKVFYDTKCE
jgi:hypothetical protein